MPAWEQYRGSLTLITGPMFAQKTTELRVRVQGWCYGDRRGAIVKFAGEDRFGVGAALATHNYPESPAMVSGPNVLVLEAHTLAEAETAMVAHYGRVPDVVGIDEGQMFSDLERAGAFADAGACVYVAALNSDFRRQPFQGVAGLAADHVISCTAECFDCHRRAATCTRRLGEQTEILVVGGADKYHSVCRPCHHRAHS